MNEQPLPISMNLVRSLLGYRRPIPITTAEMIRSLRVMFVPGTLQTPRLQEFGTKLRAAFAELGVREVNPQDAMNSAGQLVEGIVPIFLGDPQIDVLALEQLPLQSLYSSQIVGIFDRPSPVNEESGLQTRLDAIVEVMTANLVTLCVFVTDAEWVMCTMNGAVAIYENGASITPDVERGLIPKVGARVVPPRIADVTCRYEAFEPLAPATAAIVDDFLSSTRVWAESGLIGAHTSLDRFQFRSPMHKLLVSSFLDDRSGMSYGFLSWQLAVGCEAALTVAEAQSQFGLNEIDTSKLIEQGNRRYIPVTVGSDVYVVAVPDVSVICTRSGCRKDHLSGERDLVRLTLSRGSVILDTPRGITKAEECRPSYDTFTILGSALGNCLAASVLKRLQPDARYVQALATSGLSLSHWHGYLASKQIPTGYMQHGQNNPGVCCSTPQSAVFALVGKLQALEMSLATQTEFLGDVHVEPHHGTNLCGVLSLTESASIPMR